MKYLHLALRFPQDVMHPIHRFIDESTAVKRDVLVHGQTVSQQDTFLFYVEGDREPYVAALRATDRSADFETTEIDADSFYCFLRQDPDAMDKALFDSFQRAGVIVTPPIEFLPDGVAKLTVVGESDALQDAMTAVPDVVETTVERVGDYNWQQSLFDPALTDRQREAMRAAVAEGYYAVPREGGVTAVADAIGCATSTAVEHLRKAEARLVCEFVGLTDHDR
jgi:hypothetical protein